MKNSISKIKTNYQGKSNSPLVFIFKVIMGKMYKQEYCLLEDIDMKKLRKSIQIGMKTEMSYSNIEINKGVSDEEFNLE